MQKEKTQKHMKPLSKKARLSLWGFMLIFFFILGPIVLGYSLGYRFDDLEDKLTWVRTGGIYVHSGLANTDVFIDDEYFKSGGLLVRNTFAQNLKAGEVHKVAVLKEGYHTWIKELVVVESLVTEARVLMLPEEIEMDETLPYVDLDGVGTTTDSSETILNMEYREMEILFELVADPKEEVVVEKSTTTKEIPEYFVELGVEDPDGLDNLVTYSDEVAWLENGNIIMHWVGEEDEKPYYYCLLSECRDELGLDWGDEILSFDFLLNRNDVWMVLTNTGLWAVEVDDRSERNIQPIYLGENIDFRVNDKGRVVVLDEGIFYELSF